MNLKSIFKNASPEFLALNGEVPDSQPKRHPSPALEPVVAREEARLAGITLRFTGHRVKPLDSDNFAGSVKDLIDGLREAGLLAGDEYWQFQLITEQVKVAHHAEEKTEIEITWTDPCPIKSA